MANVNFVIENTFDVSTIQTVAGGSDTITVTCKDPGRGFMCEMKATAALPYKVYRSDQPEPSMSARMVADVAESIYVPPTGLIIKVTGTASFYIRAIVAA